MSPDIKRFHKVHFTDFNNPKDLVSSKWSAKDVKVMSPGLIDTDSFPTFGTRIYIKNLTTNCVALAKRVPKPKGFFFETVSSEFFSWYCENAQKIVELYKSH